MTLLIRRRPKVDDSHLPATLPPLLRQILASRGVDDPVLLERSAASLLPPHELMGMAPAVALLEEALRAERRILIVGDFDCDGATSSALCVLALRAMGALHVDFLVPNRFEYGYGLTPEIVELAEARGAELLVTVDNGISSLAGVAAAKAAGMQVLVTDHHLPGHELPAADAIVNPNQHGCGFGSKSLAGVGVAFYLMAALNTRLKQSGWFEARGVRAPNVADYLDLVALGTVADVVALDGNNRILVHQGLQRIRAGRCRPGIQALIDVSRREARRLTAADLGFALGPRLNAVGRLDDMSLGVACLLCDDINLARQLAAEMDGLNQERKEIEQGMQQEALATLEQLRFREGEVPSGIVLHRNDWHQGVVGLVASKVKEKYYRPVIAFAESGEHELKGSGRSIPGVHLRDALELLDTRHPGIISKFGGHAMAAGLTLPKDRIEAFRSAFEAVIAELVTPELLTGELLTDGSLLDEELSLEMAELIRAAGPWGQAFPEPLFDGEFALVQQRLVGEKHLKLMLTTEAGLALDAIAFGVDLRRWPDASVKRVRLVYRLDINEWRGSRNLQLLVEHLEAL
ncbi:single-stranded-DNA-specific exonuclease RecJ [Aeromonas simiae]|uniref:single-stranded-DNA-specific exonuclease RecJ n=1 Tax=Aeromonas simiae TaxID=218936 RepID=UPI0005A6A517|nr:single-stranded-DNA-specific exonuclease RecJ [Aeromonas simiae]MDO2949102.1 single-stranded-DNA-specific exonuclease RecJ [Aeromonas simiae]MDO2953956.1 single-stranded-DNA-specific exonuclease RecJ [Aeromonas simiae]MDO2956303.1 single-stranded-DNA-specific exonuclease RecJ [Aeromonas simiae]